LVAIAGGAEEGGEIDEIGGEFVSAASTSWELSDISGCNLVSLSNRGCTRVGSVNDILLWD
jgi:hypothetical protein